LKVDGAMKTIGVFLICMGTAVLICSLTGCGSSAGSSEYEPFLREAIYTSSAPEPIGPYSQGIKVGRFLYLSGQIGIDPQTGKLVEGGIEAETHQALKNLKAILEAGGLPLADVVQAQVFLIDMDEYGIMNTVYGEYFDTSPPARAVIQVARLPRDARVEIIMSAVRSD
jgi:2-iminobutanoate/2-iminopropanoate deaminase